MDVQDHPPQGEPPRRSRVEDEVLEILQKADRPPTVADQVRSKAREGKVSLGRAAAHQGRFDLRGPLAPLLGAVALALLGSLVRGASPLAASLLGVFAFAVFCSLWFAPSTGPGTGNRWRGRDLGDLPGRPPTPFRRPGPPRR